MMNDKVYQASPIKKSIYKQQRLATLSTIKKSVCYTELVYQRVNKKLYDKLSISDIERMVSEILTDSATTLKQKGKNYYITNSNYFVQLVINSRTFRLITVNRVKI